MTYQINGANGIYDKIPMDSSVRYGRNAVQNHMDYMTRQVMEAEKELPPILDYSANAKVEKNIDAMNKYADNNDAYLKSLPPLEYEYRYMPEGNGFDKKALLGAAYEELGTAEPIPVDIFEKQYVPDSDITAKPLDLNKDGKIDLGEYSTTIVVSDLLSKGTTDPTKADGVITNKGYNAMLEYAKVSNAAAAEKLYGDIYKTYDLGNDVDLK